MAVSLSHDQYIRWMSDIVYVALDT